MSQKKMKELRRTIRASGEDPNMEPIYDINGRVVGPKPWRVVKKALKKEHAL